MLQNEIVGWRGPRRLSALYVDVVGGEQLGVLVNHHVMTDILAPTTSCPASSRPCVACFTGEECSGRRIEYRADPFADYLHDVVALYAIKPRIEHGLQNSTAPASKFRSIPATLRHATLS